MKKDVRGILLISLVIIVITFLHYYTSMNNMVLHEFYRRLYYFPIILAAFMFGLSGGIITPIIVSVLYAPFVVLYVGSINSEIVSQFLEVVLFFTVGSITGILVERQKRQQLILRRQLDKITDLENYTDSILQSIAEGVAAVDSKLYITSINQYGADILGYKDYRLKITDIKGLEEFGQRILSVIEGGNSIKGMETVVGLYNTNARISIYRLISSKSRGAVLIIENIEEIKRLEEHIRRSDRLSALGELSSGIAHEIRNPLGIIKTVVQTMDYDTMDGEAREGLDVILEEIERANKVIEELLDFARNREFVFETYPLDKLLDEVIRLTDKYIKSHKVKLKFHGDNLDYINADISRLKQVFINIIFNAVQAMPEGGELNIEAYRDSGYYAVSFKDTGIGIDKKNIDKVFNPFYTTKPRGVGLGLSITHKIVEEHKGYINIESEPGKGARVVVCLPVQEV